MRVLGIDPGTEVMGFGLVHRDGSRLRHVESGALRARGPIGGRLHTLHVELMACFARATPDAVAMEDAFYRRNVRTAIRLGQAQAVVLVAAAAAGLEVAMYPPARVKQALVGNGRAAKEQVQAMVTRLLQLDAPPTPLDASDALGVAICHLQSAGRQRLAGRADSPTARSPAYPTDQPPQTRAQARLAAAIAEHQQRNRRPRRKGPDAS